MPTDCEQLTRPFFCPVSLSNPEKTQAAKGRTFTTVASGGWGLRPPDPPYGMCLSCNQVLARPGLHISSGTLAGGWARALISETNRGGTHSVRKRIAGFLLFCLCNLLVTCTLGRGV